MRLSTDSLSFGLLKSGTTSAVRHILLTNTDTTVPLSVGFASDSALGAYLITNQCGASIAPLGSCQIDVVYKPTSMGPTHGSLTFTVTGQTPITASLIGIGGRSILAARSTDGAALSTVTFADTRTNTTAAERSFTLKNVGNWPVVFDSQPLSTTLPFALTGTDCTSELAPDATCSVSATFTPTTVGLHSAPLLIASDAQDVSSLAFEGRGTAPNLGVNPSVLNFNTISVGQTQTLTATLANAGPGAATLGFSSIAAPFSMAEDCPVELGAGQSCTLTFSVTATSADSYNATLTVTGGANERSIGLSANAVNSMQGIVETLRSNLGAAQALHFEYSPSAQQLYWSPGGTELKGLPTTNLVATPTSAATSVSTGTDMAVNPTKGIAYFWVNGTIYAHVLGSANRSTYSTATPGDAGKMVVSPDGSRLYLYSFGKFFIYDLDEDGLLVLASKRTVTTPNVYDFTFDGQFLWTLTPGVGLQKRDAESLAVVQTYTAAFSPFGGSTKGMVAGSDGKYYIADRSAVYVFDPSTSALAVLAGNSEQKTQDGTGTDARFYSIQGLAWGGDRLYVWDNTHLRSVR